MLLIPIKKMSPQCRIYQDHTHTHTHTHTQSPTNTVKNGPMLDVLFQVVCGGVR